MKKHICYVVLWVAIGCLIASCSPREDESVSDSINEAKLSITDTVSEPVDEPETTQIFPLITEGLETEAPDQNATHENSKTSHDVTSTKTAIPEGQKNLLFEQRLQALGFNEVGFVDGVIDQQTGLAIAHLQWLNGKPITGETTPELFEMIQADDLFGPSAQPPYPARALSRNLPGGFEVGFLTGRLVDLGYLDDADPGFVPYGINAYAEPAVKQFQKLNGLTANGTVDYVTWAAVFSPAAVLPDGGRLLMPDTTWDWSTDFYPILPDPIDLAYDGQYIWILHSSGKDAFDNLLIRIDPKAGLLDQAPPVMLGSLESGENQIAEMLFDGNRLYLLIPRASNPPQIISLIPKTAEKFIHTGFVTGSEDGFPGNALGFDGTKIWATDNDRAWAINRNTGEGYLSYSVGWLTQGEMAFDGKCMWMAGEVGLTAFHTGGNYACPGVNEAYALPSGQVIFDGRRIWTAGWGGVYWLDTKTGLIGEAVIVGNDPGALAFDGKILWVANQGDDTVQGIDVATGSVGPALPTGSRPVALLYAAKQLWVANADDRTLQRIEIQDYQIEIIQPTATPVPSATFIPTPTETPTVPPLNRNLRLTTPYLRGDDVLQLQERLLRLGYDEIGQADGVFGPKTDQAVRRFQTINNLIVDGIVGPITWEFLFSGEANGP